MNWLYWVGLVLFILFILFMLVLVLSGNTDREVFSRKHVLSNFLRTGKALLWIAGVSIVSTGGAMLLVWLASGALGLPLPW